jgi:hypothetical protein
MGLAMGPFTRQETTMSTERTLPRFLRRATFSAALLLLAAPAALADPPGYDFLSVNAPSPATVSDSASRTAADAQIAAVDRKADRALETAQLALRQVQQRTQAAR